ncbi:E3 ubiquitin-protein ligase MBR2 isoform X1 [Ricinus communis]|uniref:E3 ubiquitin-protein ligase MBR2 isoform X1 n=1 Tax=Ricinus communis TaxID=3988 RepID=UPI00077273AE|nr:E3 ubiquitin-protein ligase MBR2 isoform X1 [Ricinus communis]|eukprot:XP_015574393.1 E3 ubiquitin-protein ligase MBR2 [Ricinus communis]
MQRKLSAVDSFPENIDTDQGSASNSTTMSQQSSINNMLNPVENRLSSDAVSYDEASCVNAISHDVQSFSGWTLGESSSRINLLNQAIDDGMEMEERWSSLVNTHNVVGPRSGERRFEPNDILLPGRGSIGISSNHVRSEQSLLQGSSSNSLLPNLNTSGGYVDDSSSDRHGTGRALGPNRFNSEGLNLGQAYTGASSNNVGPSGSSGNLLEETSGGSSSSLGGWGLSCKRKASGHSYPGGSSSCFPHAENGAWSSGTNHNSSSSLSLSPPSWNSPSVSPPEQSNTRIGFGVRGVASDAVPSSSVTGNADPLRNIGRRINASHQQEPPMFNLSTTGGARHPNFWLMNQSLRPVPFSDSMDLRSIPTANSSPPQGPAHAMHASASSRTMHPFPWNGSSTSRAGNSSSSDISGERGSALREAANLRSISRNSGERSMFVPITEMRNTGQDPAGWSLATGNMSSSASASSTRVSPSSSMHSLPSPTWLPQHNPTSQNQQRFSEFAPWSLFPSMESESGSHSGHFLSSSGPSASSQETIMSSGSSGHGHVQPFLRSAFLMEGQSDDVLGMPRSLRALAADIEGRHQLISEIRQVLNAMRRGENLRVEDYMLFDPFTHHSMAEVYDRHRDMRLDVDNMSYEELLALEERIGDVNTGLSEGTILKLMKQQKYVFMIADNPADLEPCSICQEEYVDGDDLGTLDCGHVFHTNCIKQWLVLKNICPICKMTALPA